MGTIIGIDPGLSNGGIVVHFEGGSWEAYKMPRTMAAQLVLFKELHRRTSGNLWAVIERVNEWHSDLENPGKRFGISKLINHATTLKNVLEGTGIPYREVHSKTWQAKLGLQSLPGETQSERKSRYRDILRSKVPVKVTLWNADAFMLVEFGFKQAQIDPSFEPKTATPAEGLF